VKVNKESFVIFNLYRAPCLSQSYVLCTLGLQILRERTLQLLDLIFELDVRHFAATMLHPKYRQLKGCSKEERYEACNYIREEMDKIIKND
jgi:hypothetical protein